MYVYEQALVSLANQYILDASRDQPFHCKMANKRDFLYLWCPHVCSHLAAFNYNGHWLTSLHVSR